jgi:hypothetical protein
VKRFEELLRAYDEAWRGNGVLSIVAARRALVDYVRERMKLPADLVARIERQILRFEREHDVRLSFGEVVRTLLDVALTGEEERDDD